jgi:hypothetical protein
LQLVTLGGVQTPELLQVHCAVYALPEQLSGAQTVPVGYFRQAPAPSHLPSVEHIAAVKSLQTPCGSAPPAAIDVQVPSEPGTAQLRQAPVQVVAQQTPSAQCPFTQSASAVQVWPSTFLPQVPTVPPVATVQVCPGAQSAWLEQYSVQAPPVHAKFPQLNVLAVRQVPSPSQVRVDLPDVASTQTACPQAVLTG